MNISDCAFWNSKFCVEVGSVYMRGEKTKRLSCGCVDIGMRICEVQGMKGSGIIANSPPPFGGARDPPSNIGWNAPPTSRR